MKIKFLLVFLFLKNCSFFAQNAPISLNWLGKTPPSVKTGLSWGVPFERGKIQSNQTFSLKNGEGKTMPLQTWTNAVWDDGSLKWLGLATVAEGSEKGFELKIGEQNTVVQRTSDIVHIKNAPLSISIQTGKISCVIPKTGATLLDSLTINGKLIGTNGRLIGYWQNAPDGELESSQIIERQSLTSKIQKVEIEQKGDLKTVVRIEGIMTTDNLKSKIANPKSIMPFIIRLYFFADVEQIRIVQTLIYDGIAEQDFIKGIGWEFAVPMREEVLNRHIRFGGESPTISDVGFGMSDNGQADRHPKSDIRNCGIFAEPVQPLTGRRPLLLNRKPVYEQQVLGKRVPNTATYDKTGQDLIKDWAKWRDFRLTQNTADGFSIQKRTHDKGAWIDAQAGHRARGLVFLGDASGGLSLGIRNFWQSHPAALEVKNASRQVGDLPLLRGWIWSPFAEAMDMRHYDTLTFGHGLEASYEDVQPEFSTATGVARTSELTVFLHDSVPSNQHLSQISDLVEQPPLLMTTPQYLHDVGAFGVWSLPNRTTKTRQWIENQLDTAIVFYQKEIEQRRWYGYFNYGDVMHGYDSTRHSWRYDIGGYAWANTELMPDLWLWYSFLRTGRADIFRMAEAMTRHTSEVDVYHLGRFAGLGSRHNVRHWGCGAKEIRISQASLKRFLYYLTTDERTGELMREVANADEAMTKTDPLRLILPKSDYPTHARVGPDWFALVGNWLTEWERTGNPIWKEKILRGVKSYSKMPFGFFSGVQGAFGYDPKTNELHQLAPSDIGQSHLSILMGGPEIAFELSRFLDDADWQKLWLQYCQLYGAPKTEVVKAFGKDVQLGELSPHFCRMPAYFAFRTKNKALAEQTWATFLAKRYYRNGTIFDSKNVKTPETLRPIWEVPNVSTNNTAQWCLNAIELLELIGADLPER